MRKTALFALIACLCLALLAGCAPAQVQPVAYTNKDLGLSLTYAGNWGLREDTLNAAVIVAAPAAKAEDFAANLVITAAQPAEGFALAGLTAEQLTPAGELAEFALEEFDAARAFKGEPAVYLRYTHTYNGDVIRVDQYLQLHNGTLYTYTFSCEKAVYADYEMAIISLRDSIAYTKAASPAPSASPATSPAA